MNTLVYGYLNGMGLTQQDLEFLQNGLVDVGIAALKGMGDNFIIRGCEKINVSSGVFDFNAGIIFLDDEVCVFDGATSVSFNFFTQVAVWEKDISFDPAGNRPYGDNVSHDRRKIVKAVLNVYTAPYNGSGLVFVGAKRMADKVAELAGKAPLVMVDNMLTQSISTISLNGGGQGNFSNTANVLNLDITTFHSMTYMSTMLDGTAIIVRLTGASGSTLAISQLSTLVSGSIITPGAGVFSYTVGDIVQFVSIGGYWYLIAKQ